MSAGAESSMAIDQFSILNFAMPLDHATGEATLMGVPNKTQRVQGLVTIMLMISIWEIRFDILLTGPLMLGVPK